MLWKCISTQSRQCSQDARPPPRLIDTYHLLVESGRIRHDPSQQVAIERLAVLQQRVETGFVTLGQDEEEEEDGPRREKAASGIFLWGKVGSGKSMAMDLFYRTTLVDAEDGAKLRIHFHEFMIKVHEKMHHIQNKAPTKVVLTKSGRKIFKREPLEEHPVDLAARAIAEHECRRLLCLDEIQVTDSADAMIVRHLFEALAREGVAVVFTANVPPEGLYSNPFLAQSREFFEPFVALIRDTMQVVLVQGGIDYRTVPVPESEATDELATLINGIRVGAYVDTSGTVSTDAFEEPWRQALGGRPEPPPTSLTTAFGRSLEVVRHAGESARFSFDELCRRHPDGTSLGAPDFVALSEAYSTVFVSGLRPLRPHEREEARRLVLLVDTLYEGQVRLYCSASCRPGDIFEAVRRHDECKLEEKLGYARAASRLRQMAGAAG